MPKSKSRKKKPPKRVLALPDLEHAKMAVLKSLTSAGSVRPRDALTDDGPHHIETSTSDSRASAPVASTSQDCGAERRIVAPIARTRFQGIPP